MPEFDDFLTQMQLIKNKIVCADERDIAHIVSNKSDTYNYLESHILYSNKDMEKLKARIMEVYMDIFKSEEREPDIADITEVIDGENMGIIASFYRSFNYSMDVTEDMLAIYIHEISPYLDEWIEQILIEEQKTFVGMSLAKEFEKNHTNINSYADCFGQNIVNPELV